MYLCLPTSPFPSLTLLQCCVATGNKFGIDVDAPTGDGTTPLHLACYGGHLAAAKLLVDEFGADLHATNAYACSAAHWACMGRGSGTLGLVQWLWDKVCVCVCVFVCLL